MALVPLVVVLALVPLFLGLSLIMGVLVLLNRRHVVLMIVDHRLDMRGFDMNMRLSLRRDGGDVVSQRRLDMRAGNSGGIGADEFFHEGVNPSLQLDGRFRSAGVERLAKRGGDRLLTMGDNLIQ